MSGGIIAGTILLVGGITPSEPWHRFAIAVALYAPTPVQIYWQRYAFKVFSRFCLGTGISLAVSAVALGYPWNSPLASLNIGFIASFVGVAFITHKWRAPRVDVPCFRCVEGQFPFCTWRHRVIQKVLDGMEVTDAELPQQLRALLEVADAELRAMAEGTRIGRISFATADATSNH